MKKVQLNVVFFKNWTLKTVCESISVGEYLKSTLKEKIDIKNNKIVSLFNIKINSNFTWLIMDAKRNLLALDASVPKKIIILGIDLKAFYNNIISYINTNPIRMINRYIEKLYGYKLYEDNDEDEIEVKPISKELLENVIMPVVVQEKKEEQKVEIIKKHVQPKLEKEEKKQGEKKEQKEKAAKQEINKETVVKEKIASKQKEKKENDIKPIKKEVLKGEKVKPRVQEIKQEKKENKIKEEANKPKTKNELKDKTEKGSVKKVNKKGEKKEVKKEKESQTDESLVKKKKEPVSEKKKNKTEKKTEEKPKEIQIVLNLNDNQKTNNANKLYVIVPKENENEKSSEEDTKTESNKKAIEEENIQKISFTVLSPTGQVLFSKVIRNSVPMTPYIFLKMTGLPIIESSEGFIQSIAGINNAGMSGWVYEVNGSPIMASATDYVINPEDQITWKYVSFEPIDLPLEETDEMTMDVMEEPISRKVR